MRVLLDACVPIRARSNRLRDLLPLVPALLEALRALANGEVRAIGN